MKEIILACGRKVQVSDEDFDYLNQWKWYFIKAKGKENDGYASRPKLIKMHIEIVKKMGVYTILKEVDHKDRNKLNNQRENLRMVTRSQNQHNVSVRVNSSTGAKGISFRNGKYEVRIQVNGERINHGRFVLLEEAIKERERLERYFKVNQ